MRVQSTGNRQFTVDLIKTAGEAARLTRFAVASDYMLELRQRNGSQGRTGYITATRPAWLEQELARTVLLSALVDHKTPAQILEGVARHLEKEHVNLDERIEADDAYVAASVGGSNDD